MPYLTIAQAALARWRGAQHLMDLAEPESPAWREAFLEAELAKADYQQAIDDAMRTHNQVPIPFDEASMVESDVRPKTDMGAEGIDGEVYGG